MEETMKKVDWELKKRKFFEKLKGMSNSAAKWYHDNEETIRFWAPIAIPAGAVLLKNYKKGRAARI